MKTVSFALAGLAILASAAYAQKQLPVHNIRGEKSMQIGAPAPKTTTALIYQNTAITYGWGLPNAGVEWMDWGVTDAANAGHNTVIYMNSAFSTYAPHPNGPTMIVRTYDGYTGGCQTISPGGLAVAIGGLPGNLFTIWATRWTFGVNLQGIGCFDLPEGEFGYSFEFDDGLSGPVLAWDSDVGQGSVTNRFDMITTLGTCIPGYWFGTTVWAGFYVSFTGWKESTDMGMGTGSGLVMSIAGNSCPGGVVNVSLVSPNPVAFTAMGVGAVAAPGIGGGIGGGQSWDIGMGVGVPPIFFVFGTFPGSFAFPVTLPTTLLSGLQLYGQTVHAFAGGVRQTSNVPSLNVP